MNDANLKPVQPGEVRNPKGINQYTYRADALKNLDKWLKLHGDEVIERCVKEAKHGEPWAMRLIFERALPVVKEVDHRFPDGIEPVKVPATDERISALAELFQETLH